VRLHTNNTVSNKNSAGSLDWGRRYMDEQKGWIETSWYDSIYRDDSLFYQFILWEVSYVR